MFKIPNPEDQQRLVEEYDVLAKNSRKDGKPYILSMHVGRQLTDGNNNENVDPRSQGWTVVAETRFASLADMRYYDEADAAHAALREKAKKGCGIVGGPAGVLTVYFEAGVEVGAEKE
ncbi:hypothetical protein SLS62_000048 [Diatrype stigma]|uniref:Stress-response A/B barrel domain-containing protein n=1 Tax=Diatrype stigma TaxID=117547 RepID=A0AAN9YUP4_9PEZI